MTRKPELSRGETAVARVLWQLGRASVREVFEALPATPPMEFATVQTYLRRLEKKGYATATLDGRNRIYVPKVKALTVIRRTIDDLVERLFGGESFSLVRHVVEEHELSDDELAELKRLIDRRERREN